MIHDIALTNHAEQRMRQRGIRDADIGLLLTVAERVSEDALLLTRQRAAREIERRRREIQQLERLRGTRLIIEDGALVTVYHEHRSGNRAKRAFRNRRKS